MTFGKKVAVIPPIGVATGYSGLIRSEMAAGNEFTFSLCFSTLVSTTLTLPAHFGKRTQASTSINNIIISTIKITLILAGSLLTYSAFDSAADLHSLIIFNPKAVSPLGFALLFTWQSPSSYELRLPGQESSLPLLAMYPPLFPAQGPCSYFTYYTAHYQLPATATKLHNDLRRKHVKFNAISQLGMVYL